MSDLGDRAEALRREVSGLREDVQALRARQATNERRLWWIAATVIAALALVAFVGVTAYRGLQTDQRVDQTAQRVDAICPVLALVVGGYDPTSRPAGPARERYEQGFAVMRQSYVDLGCEKTSPLVPPRATP